MNVATPPKTRMKVPEFLDWAEKHEGRFELAGGEIVEMAPEQVRHALVKGAAYRALWEAVNAAGIDCTVFPDGVTVIIDDETAREPDASVQCGPYDLKSTTIDAPVIVVEVASPSTVSTDMNIKLAEYFSVPSIRHYLIVAPEKSLVVHHQKGDTEEIATRILRDGDIALTPPGIRISVAALLGPAAAAPAKEANP